MNVNCSEKLALRIKVIRFTFRWFSESADVYSFILLINLICNMMTLACCTFQLDLQLQHMTKDLGIIVTIFMVTSCNLFIYCYFGKLATESYEEMACCLYNANWTDLSVNLQKYFIIMIANAQRPNKYHGFGVAILDLKLFMGVS